MNPILLEVVAWFLEKALIEAGKGADWGKIQTDLERKLDDMIPGLIADKIANYVLEVLISIVSDKLSKAPDPTCPQVIQDTVEKAKGSLLGKIVLDLFEAKK